MNEPFIIFEVPSSPPPNNDDPQTSIIQPIETITIPMTIDDDDEDQYIPPSPLLITPSLTTTTTPMDIEISFVDDDDDESIIFSNSSICEGHDTTAFVVDDDENSDFDECLFTSHECEDSNFTLKGTVYKPGKGPHGIPEVILYYVGSYLWTKGPLYKDEYDSPWSCLLVNEDEMDKFHISKTNGYYCVYPVMNGKGVQLHCLFNICQREKLPRFVTIHFI